MIAPKGILEFLLADESKNAPHRGSTRRGLSPTSLRINELRPIERSYNKPKRTLVGLSAKVNSSDQLPKPHAVAYKFKLGQAYACSK